MTDSRDQEQFLRRYGATILRSGIAAIPFALFKYQAELGLTCQQVWFICYILAHRWSSSLPHPSLKRLAERSGLTARMLHNYKQELVDLGYLRVIARLDEQTGAQYSNAYDFGPLFERLEELIVRDAPDTPVDNPIRQAPARGAGDGGEEGNPGTTRGRANRRRRGRAVGVKRSSSPRVKDKTEGDETGFTPPHETQFAGGDEAAFARRDETDSTPRGEGRFPRRRIPRQEDSYQEEQQQRSPGQARPQGSSAASRGRGEAGVVVVSQASSAGSREELKELRAELLEMGIHHRTADKLLRVHDVDRLEDVLDYVQWKLDRGWQPEESAAGWIVAALTESYKLPPAFLAAGDGGDAYASDEDQGGGAANRGSAPAASAAAEAFLEREGRKMDQERAARLKRLGIDRQADDLWREALDDLRERGEWSPALSACLLRRAGRADFEILVPWDNIRPRVEGRAGVIRALVSRLLGELVGVSVKVAR